MGASFDQVFNSGRTDAIRTTCMIRCYFVDIVKLVQYVPTRQDYNFVLKLLKLCFIYDDFVLHIEKIPNGQVMEEFRT